MKDVKIRYSKVSRRIWNDERFRSLSGAAPNAQTLFLRLLSGPELTNIPGLFSAWEGGLSDALRWPREGFRKAFDELVANNMVLADWDAGLVWVPKAVEHNRPESPNVVRSWRATYDELPECPLKHDALEHLRASIGEMGEGFRVAFAETFPEREPLGRGRSRARTREAVHAEQAPPKSKASEQAVNAAATSPPAPGPPSAPLRSEAPCTAPAPLAASVSAHSPEATHAVPHTIAAPPAQSLRSIPSFADSQSQSCPPDLPMTSEARAVADNLGLRDIELVWAGFVGYYSSRPRETARLCDWYAGRWTKWVAKEVQTQRTERARDAARASPAEIARQTKLAPHVKFPEPIRFPRKDAPRPEVTT